MAPAASSSAHLTKLRPLQEVLSVSNEVAAELATVDDGILDALRDRLGIALLLRGNRLTLEGDDARVGQARAVVDELVELVEGGQAIGPSTVDAVLAALDAAENPREIFEDVVWRHRGKKITPKTVNQKRYVDAIRECTITFGVGPAGTGKTYLAMALAVAAMQERAREVKSGKRGAAAKADGAAQIREKIAEMPEPDKSMAQRIHEIVTTNGPELTQRTFYGMPAYAKDG